MRNFIKSTIGRRAAAVVASLGALIGMTAPVAAQELIIGEETVHPGIVFIFEAAVRDDVSPQAQHLSEGATDIHIEARVNWHADDTMTPDGTPGGGFVAYLNLTAEVTHEVTGAKQFVSLLPHVNLIDSLHYARNMALPGEAGDLYTVRIYVYPPDPFALSLHRDWRNNYGRLLMAPRIFTYRNVNFFDIVTAPPRASSFEGPGVAE